MRASKNKSMENGSAVIYILLTLLLFAALAYSFMRGTQQGQGNMTTQQAKMLAGEILDYANMVEQGVGKLLARGCSEKQISFEHDGIYVNANAPADKSCDVFDPAGAGLTYTDPPSNSTATAVGYGFNSANYVISSGNTTAELALFMPFSDATLCHEINRTLGLSSTAFANDKIRGSEFDGTFDATPNGFPDEGGSAAAFENKMAACLLNTGSSATFEVGSPTYFFYKVLIRR